MQLQLGQTLQFKGSYINGEFSFFFSYSSSSSSGAVPPKIVEHPQNITIEEGDTLILKCVARGFPAPFMTWYLKGRTLITNSFTVEISEASKSEHEGLYLCEAQNPAGTVSASAVVTVRGG